MSGNLPAPMQLIRCCHREIDIAKAMRGRSFGLYIYTTATCSTPRASLLEESVDSVPNNALIAHPSPLIFNGFVCFCTTLCWYRCIHKNINPHNNNWPMNNLDLLQLYKGIPWQQGVQHLSIGVEW